MRCRFCLCDQTIKYGKIRDKQRYRCKECNKHFIIELSPKRIDAQTKLKALSLLKEGMGFQATGRVLGVSFSSVKRWFRNKGELIKQAHSSKEVNCTDEISFVELDELCHYLIGILYIKLKMQ